MSDTVKALENVFYTLKILYLKQVNYLLTKKTKLQK